MRAFRAAVGVLAASLLVPLLAAAPASAVSRWTRPEALGAKADWVQIEVSPKGAAVALWAVEGVLRASYRPAGRNWAAPELVARDTYGGEVYIDGDGKATALWLRDGRMHFSDRLPDGTWHADRDAPVEELGVNCEQAFATNADSAGNLVVAWTDNPDCEGYTLRSRVVWRFADGSWGNVKETGELEVQAVTVHDGEATFFATEGGAVTARTATMGDDAGEPETVLEATGQLGVAANARGDVLVALTQTSYVLPGNGTTRLVTRARPAGGEWQPVRMSAWSDGVAGWPSVEVHDDGTGAVAYSWEQSDKHQVRASIGSVSTDEWTPPAAVSGDLADKVTHVDAAAGRDGAAAVAWSTAARRTVSTQASYRPSGGAWQAPETMAGEGPSGLGRRVEVAGYPNGMFTAVFTDGAPMYSDHVDDSVAPSTRMLAPSKDFVTSTRVPVRWRSTDAFARVRDMDVRVRSAGRAGGFSGWSVWLRRTTDTAAPFAGRPGRTYCFSARARDRVGNLGAWSRERCATTPLDDRAFEASGAWTGLTDRSAYRRTLTSATAAGARLRLENVNADRLRLVAHTCRTCGTVRVTHAGRDLGAFSLRSKHATAKHVILLADYPRARRGALVVRVVSRGRAVRVDGVIASR